MGHRISAAGIQPDRAKVAAILDMPPPDDVHGVRRLCGMVQYLAKFLPNLASDLEPVRALTKKECEWNWTRECDEALRLVKEKVTKAPVLAFFNPNKELVLQVDSSKSGIGAVIMQDGQPIEYASRALTPSEQNWAQLEKEALALVYGLERFDQYTYGRAVRVQNDHKPLETILRKPLSQASRRVQALMMRLYRYDFRFQYVQGTQLFIADALSRAYVPNPIDDVCVLAISSLTNIADKTRMEVQEATKKDPGMQVLLRVIREGWPERKNDVPECVRMYFDVRDTLSEQDGVVLKGERILVPQALRNEMRKRLHAAHLGYDSMLRRARELLFWPGMAQDIKQTADSCEACQQMKPCNQKETLIQHGESPRPWMKVGTDLFECDGRAYLLTVDYYSSFIEVDYLTGTTANDVITKLQGQFARYGIPAEIVSDQGPQYTSAQFQQMTEEWGITHTMSSPGHHQSNGKAEAAVKTVKHMLYKCLQNNSNPYMAMLELRNTPMQDTGLSPTQMMFGHFTRTRLPAVNDGEVNKKQSAEAKKKRRRRRRTVKKCYNKQAKDLTTLSAGQTVFFQHVPGQRWRKGTIRSRDGDREYIVEGDNGGVYQRNRVHMRPTSIKSTPTLLMDANALDHALEQTAVPVSAAANREPGPPDIALDVSEPMVTPTRPQRVRNRPVWLDSYVTDF
jgi:transposase InsO family protein